MRISFRHKIAAEVHQAPAASAKTELQVKPNGEDEFVNGMAEEMAKSEKRAKRMARLEAIGSEYSPKTEKK